MRASSNASQMAAVYRLHGSVMATLTAQMVQMSTTPAPRGPAPPRYSAVITATVCSPAGYVMVTMTVGTAATNATVLHPHSAAPAGSGSAPATVCVSISAECVIIHPTARMEQMSRHFAVSDSFSVL